MHLKKAFWCDGLSSSPRCDAEQSPSPEVEEPVIELVESLQRQRLYREVTLALRNGLRDSRAEFSFLRLRGLRSLLKFLRSVSESPTAIDIFCHAQSIPDLQVLFQNSLKCVEDERVETLDHIFTVEALKITSPSSDAEVALSLRVLEGCCLLHKESSNLALQFKPVTVLMNILSSRGVLGQCACLDALITLMLDSSANQTEFESCDGIKEVAELIRDNRLDENVRMKCGEFLLLFIGHINGRERTPIATIHEDLKRLLGEKSASLIWAASRFGSSLDMEQRLIALHIQARRVLESLDMH